MITARDLVSNVERDVDFCSWRCETEIVLRIGQSYCMRKWRWSVFINTFVIIVRDVVFLQGVLTSFVL
jgi:hypothetical protein